MLENNTLLYEKHRDILSFRDLAPGTVKTYLSYLGTFIGWVEENLPERDLSSVTWEEVRSFLLWLKEVRGLNPLIKANPAKLPGLLFRCVQETLLSLCADPKFLGAVPGIISVLHTWGQKLSFHPHLHVCISGGGLTPSGKFVEAKHKGFFLPWAVIASMFRGKYLCGQKTE